jgi:HPt (histidine-containing phosphotransfer) domain-containing protein
MNGYLSKPFKAHELFAAVESWTAATVPAARPVPVDLEAFRATMREAGVEDTVDAIVATFVTALPGFLDTLATAVAAKDAVAIRRAAHSLKAAAGSIGAAGLATLLVDLEAVARDGTGEPVGHAFEQVRLEAAAVLGHLRAAGVP